MTTPKTFRFQDESRYPIDNTEDFEYWLSKNMPDKVGEYTWLPVTWTAYYKTCAYGSDKGRMKVLQDWLDQLPPDKYATCVQWDDGILHQLPAGTRIYAMGSPGDYQLPLICQPHAYNAVVNKDIFCSFVGRVTHPIRQQIVDQLRGKPGYFIQTQAMRLNQFCEVLARSRYALAPRGYGMTSFRICEALQYGAAPIYISDTFLRPHNKEWSLVKEVSGGDIFSGRNLKVVIDSFDQHPNANKARALYQSHFTYEANKKLIIEDLKKQ